MIVPGALRKRHQDVRAEVIFVNDVVVLDRLDRAILTYIQQDGRMPFTAIADRLRVAEGTVRKRVARLLEEGVVRVTGVVDPLRLGMSLVAMVGISVEGDLPERVVSALVKLPEVRYVAVCTGAYDIIMEVVLKSNNELYEFLAHKLRKVPGIAGSQTSLILKVCKESSTWDGWARVEEVEGGHGQNEASWAMSSG